MSDNRPHSRLDANDVNPETPQGEAEMALVVAILMTRAGIQSLNITQAEIDQLPANPGVRFVRELDDSHTISLIRMKDAG